MKSTILSLALFLFASNTFADTLPPDSLPSESFPTVSQQSTSSNQAESGFTYPAVTHLESEAIINDIVFFYPPEMVEVFEGDLEKLVDYVQRSVDVNNLAFRRQNIPLRRNIAGVVAIPSELTYRVDGDSRQRILDLGRLYNDSRYNYNFFYDASYVVALTPHIREAVNSIGSAEVGGKYSWVSPFKKDEDERTLAHELGHNDGFSHDREEYDELPHANKNLRFSSYSNGDSCGNFNSIMRNGSGNRDEGFFSSPLVTNAQGVQCGTEHRADSARAYLEAIADHIPNRKAPFANNKPAREATGTVSLSVVSTIVNEGQPIVIDIHWAGAELGDSVQVLTRKGTASISDFRSTLKSIYFDGENNTSQIEIETYEDDKFELDETMEIALIFPHGVSISGDKSQEVTIISDDVGNAGIIEFTASTATLSKGQSRTLTLQRTGGSDGEFTVNVITEAGTADNNDFRHVDRNITFSQGETSKSVTISALNNTKQDGTKTFTVRVTGNNQLIGETDEVAVTIAAYEAPANDADVERQGASTGPFFFIMLTILAFIKFRYRAF